MEFHVAPMKGISNWTFRAKCVGATDSYTEMIQLWEILKKKPRAIQKLDLKLIEKQNQWVQILTNSPRDMTRLPACLDGISKAHPERSHIFGININAGCPDPQIISAGQGAALIKRRKRISDLVCAFLRSPDHPYQISLKFRLGMHMGDVTMKILLNVLENLSTIDDSRLNTPIIHFKHAKQQSDEEPIWEFLNPLLDSGYPFILNGNIHNPKDLVILQNDLELRRKALFTKNMKGVMIGRALLTNPSLFLDFQ